MTVTAPVTNPKLDFLNQRNSAPRLQEPGPDDAQLQDMLRAALRSPDHAWLRPWRFVSFQGDRRRDVGELFLQSLLRSNPDSDAAAREKALGAALRAPLVIAVFAVIKEHPKVPPWEQKVSAGCAAFSVSLAAEALGFGCVWRTGAYAEDKQMLSDLGGKDNEECVAFLYIGTRSSPPKALPVLEPDDFHRAW